MSDPARSPVLPAPAVPPLFVSHGSPTFALDPGTTGPALSRWARALTPRPRAVVVVSPHWMTRQPVVMTNPAPATWHDFGGFPAPLYQLQYPAPGDAALGEQVRERLAQAGIAALADARRPLDHGAWVPLMHLFPEADLPVVQLSLPAGWGAREVYAMGQALAPLAADGVLLMGSGSMTHNLGEFFRGAGADTPPYVTDFARWVEQAVVRADRDTLLAWPAGAPHAHRAHPTDEHFLPLFFTLGAAGWGRGPAPAVAWLSREVVAGLLAMDAFALVPAAPTVPDAPLEVS